MGSGSGWVAGLGLGGPCSLSSWCHPTHLPLPTPTHHPPAGPIQPHKALFMPGGWPGAPEGGWGRRGGSRTRQENIWKHSREAPPPPALGLDPVRSSLLLPAGRPPPQAPPSQPQLPLAPATSKEAEGESEQRGDPGLVGLGWGALHLRDTGPNSHPTDRHCCLDGSWDPSTPSTQCLDYLFRTPKLYSSLHIG